MLSDIYLYLVLLVCKTRISSSLNHTVILFISVRFSLSVTPFYGELPLFLKNNHFVVTSSDKQRSTQQNRLARSSVLPH